jgi:hypothetical protein
VGLKLALEHECNIATGIEAGWMLGRISPLSFEIMCGFGNESRIRSRPLPTAASTSATGCPTSNVKDVNVYGEWRRIGEGVIDYPGRLRAPQQDGYAGFLSLEAHYTTPGVVPRATPSQPSAESLMVLAWS